MSQYHPCHEKVKPQLPVSYYFDQALYERELATFFNSRAAYLGHKLLVPEVGDFYALPQENEGRVLVHGHHGIELISNICRHRQAVMYKGRGSLLSGPNGGSGNLVCPLHRWTYSGVDAKNSHLKMGNLLGAPHFDEHPCLHLNNYPVQEWNGLIFENKKDQGIGIRERFEKLSVKPLVDFSNYVFDRVELHECNYNWKTFIEVYLEDYHVAPFHTGLGSLAACDELVWEFNPHYSVQTVGLKESFIKKDNQKMAGSNTYEKWRKSLLDINDPKISADSIVWLLHYPGVMIERYPNMLAISTIYPISVDKTLNVVEFYYSEEYYLFERDYIAAQQAAYMETCCEDDELAIRMDQGRRVLLQRGENEVGPYQSPMEDGMVHFHQWYRHEMGL